VWDINKLSGRIGVQAYLLFLGNRFLLAGRKRNLRLVRRALRVHLVVFGGTHNRIFVQVRVGRVLDLRGRA